MELLFYDEFKAQNPENEDSPMQRKTEDEVIEHIEKFTEQRLRITYPNLSSLDPDAWQDIAANLIGECVTEIKTIDSKGIVSYRTKFQLKQRQAFLEGNLQFVLWDICAEAIEALQVQLGISGLGSIQEKLA